MSYRRATTADLAQRCGVQEMALYRLWPDKRAMFIAAIEHVYESSLRRWQELPAGDGSFAERLLRFESEHLGEFGLYRILFAGLSESDDPAIGKALRATYRRFVRFIADVLKEHDDDRPLRESELAAWAFVGLATAANLGRELGILGADARRRLLTEFGGALLGAGRGG